nr:hypothetical protein [Seonamhaeicola sp. ML3]
MNKLLSERHVNVTSSEVKSLGVVLNIDEYEDIESLKALGVFFNVHPNNIKIIAFSENKSEQLNTWDDCFGPKDFGWKGTINNEVLKSFLEHEFDVLISYYKQDQIELKLVTALSKGKLKVGILQTDERLNDLIIKTDIEKFEVFKNELFKYLKILNKIRNEQ